MKLKLQSDFHDYYDHWFDLDGEIFRRITTDGLNRKEMFVFMNNIGLRVIPHGTVGRDIPKSEKVVVYSDINKHCGEGKYCLSVERAEKLFSGELYSEYIPTGGLPTSFRWLVIGHDMFYLKYVGVDWDRKWRSNFDSFEIVLANESFVNPRFRKLIPRALFAIDFVSDRYFYYAIDFNIAPGIKGSPVEGILSAKEAVTKIKEWIERKEFS